MRITIVGKAPSVNSLYQKGQHGNIYLTKDGRIYKREVGKALRQLCAVLPDALKHRPLLVVYTFFFPALWGDQGPILLDVDNRVKIVQDAVANALKFNDAWIWAIVASKCEGQERAVVQIEAFDKKNFEGFLENLLTPMAG